MFGNPSSTGLPSHEQEQERLARLRDYGILDTDREAVFDKLIELASFVTASPLGAISFVDGDRQWFKATYGFDKNQTARSFSFCSHTIAQPGAPFVVHDAAKDARFSDSPLVTSPPHVRFYAGIPMLSMDGLPLGSFCVMDQQPRTLTVRQMQMLQHISGVAMDLVEAERHRQILLQHVAFHPEKAKELPGSICRLAAPFGPIYAIIADLLDQYEMFLHGICARVSRFPIGGSHEVYYLPAQLAPAQVGLWLQLDAKRTAHPEAGEHGLLERDFAGDAGNFHATIPLKFNGRTFARVDFICPAQEERRLDQLFRFMVAAFVKMAETEIRTHEFKFKSEHDPLTGLGNRSMLIAEIDKALRMFPKSDPQAVLLQPHLESLIEVNDNFGYSSGDHILVELAGRLQRLNGGNNFTARVSGNEFAVLVTGLGAGGTFAGGLRRLLDEAEELLGRPYLLARQELHLQTNIGCAVLDDPSAHPVEMLRRAEASMREAGSRESGPRHHVHIYNEPLLSEGKKRHHLNLLVREAFRESRFFLLFQPVVDLADGRVSGAEALLRLRDKQGVVVEAARFLPAVERIRYQAAMDRWVFAEFIRLAGTNDAVRCLWNTGDFSFFLNATPAILSSESFADDWLSQLDAAGIPATHLVIEVVENPLITRNETMIENLRHLRAGGVRIAVDDFGSGYSNLRHLAGLPVDIVKLDRSLIAGSSKDQDGTSTVVSGIVNICHALGYQALAEGVETEEQASRARQVGCRYAQGFLYGKAARLEEILQAD